ncbi:MAG: CBS domain-containing protein [Syntrophotaleaceae bacterium]
MDVITTHINADFDCLGSMIAAKKLYPQAEMVFAGAQERNLREFFLQSADYAFRFKRIRDIDLEAITRLILVDVCQLDRIGPFADVARRKGVEVHVYDHHPVCIGSENYSLVKIEPVGSTVTILTHLFMEKSIRPSPEEATMMLLGLYEDTGKLLFNSTTVRDYQAAAFLLEQGANLNTVADFLTQELTADQVSLLHELIESRAILNANGIDIAVAHASIDHFVGDLAVLAHKLKDMENLNALIVAVRMGDRVFLVGRSRIPEVHVGEILAEFGGGGHSFAASGTLRNMTLVQFLDKLPQVLSDHVQPRWEARHLMFTAVKTVPVNATVNEAREVLTRYNINALPIMDGSRVAGVITRQVLEKAAHHDLANVPVSEYMSFDFVSVSPSTPVSELQALIVDRDQRFVPVVEQGKLIGAITRTDLLRHLISGATSRRMKDAPALASRDLSLKRRYVVRLMKDRLSPRIQEMLEGMGRVGDDLQVDVFAVGGFVRDLLLREENFDVDIVVEGDGIAFAAEFARRFDCRIRTHRKFGTAVVIFPDGFKVDIASARTEYYVAPGALPTVEHAPIKLDLYRRDFTINTLAIALNQQQYGELYDFFGAQRDLQEKAIRVLHNLSFVEDPTRVFRAIRFEQRLNFEMGGHTEHLLRSAVRMGFLEKVGGPRVLNELILIMKESDPLPAILRMAEFKLLQYIHPDLNHTDRLRSLFANARRAINWYDLLFTGEPCRRWTVYFLCLLSNLDREGVCGVCRRLSVTPRLIELFTDQREEIHRLTNQLFLRETRRNPATPSEVSAWFQGLATEVLLYGMARAENEQVQKTISHYFTHLRSMAPALSGEDLKQMGIPPGPLYKVILQELLDGRLDGRLLTRKDEKEFVRRRYPEAFRSAAKGKAES